MGLKVKVYFGNRLFKFNDSVWLCGEKKQYYKRQRKELSFCHKFRFSNSYIFAIQCRRPLIFQTMNSVSSNSLSLKQQMFAPSGCKDIGIWKLEFVGKTKFLYIMKTIVITKLGRFCFVLDDRLKESI